MGGKIFMKKKLMSVLLAAAMVASMAVGCGSDKKASSDSGDTKKTDRLLHRLRQISSTHMEHGMHMIHHFQKKTLQSMYQQVDPDREQKQSSMELLHLVWWQEV